MANRLQHEKSPYLLQHAANPVDWYAWGNEAFEAARREEKPIFLSIGYSTCHWCHVMAHESFEDAQVAQLLNDTFVNIKVDREERPDIDSVYMAVCQMLTQSGGWPLTIIMTPDQRPFFAATYIRKHSRYGQTGMMDLIPRIHQIWQTQRKQAMESADHVVAALRESAGAAVQTAEMEVRKTTPAIFSAAWEQFSERFDPVYGGFGTAPKFPTPHNLLLLLRHWKRTGKAEALLMVEKTLQGIRRGGVYDQIGFGVHRYSTDQEWLVPHFEKMLYDQALLAMACTETWQATHKPLYAQMARDTVTYVLRDMTNPAGGFYSAQDADSEGIEGKFYVWTEQEIREVLAGREADVFIDTYNIRPGGNYKDEAPGEPTGKNIPHLTDPMMVQDRLIVTTPDPGDLEILESARRKLFHTRETRIHLGKDDKILTDWSGLMIAALAKAAAALDEPLYSRPARLAVEFMLKHLRTPQGRLLHRYRQGEAGIAGDLDDYAFFIWGLIELYEAGFDTDHLQIALDLMDDVILHFWDDAAGGFFFTADDAEDILVRQKPIYDGAVPSGNSVMMYNLLRLGWLTGRSTYEEKADELYRAFASQIAQSPLAYTQMLASLDFAIGPTYEVVVAGASQEESTHRMLGVLSQAFLPNTVVLLRPADKESPAITTLVPFIAQQVPRDGHAVAYVCRRFECQAPTTDVDEMMQMLSAE